MKKYKSAAKHFLQASFDHCEYKEVTIYICLFVHLSVCLLFIYLRLL